MKFIIIRKSFVIFLVLLFIFLFTILFFIFNANAPVLETSSLDEDDFFSRVQNLVNQKEKIAYLTFDDGPTLKSTGKILDILKSENVKATFL